MREPLVRNRLDPVTVIPAKAGIQTSFASLNTKIHWIPAFAGMTILFFLCKNNNIWPGGLNGYVSSTVAQAFNHMVSKMVSKMRGSSSCLNIEPF